MRLSPSASSIETNHSARSIVASTLSKAGSPRTRSPRLPQHRCPSRCPSGRAWRSARARGGCSRPTKPAAAGCLLHVGDLPGIDVDAGHLAVEHDLLLEPWSLVTENDPVDPAKSSSRRIGRERQHGVLWKVPAGTSVPECPRRHCRCGSPRQRSCNRRHRAGRRAGTPHTGRRRCGSRPTRSASR